MEQSKGSSMKTTMGVWIDHRKATIVTLTDEGEDVKQITSHMEKHIRYTGSSHSKTPEGGKEVTSEDGRDRRFTNHLNQYYDDVIACLHEAESILIFGPGEARGELEKRLMHEKFAGRIIEIESETVDKMTDRQIAAKVRQHFHPTQRVGAETAGRSQGDAYLDRHVPLA